MTPTAAAHLLSESFGRCPSISEADEAADREPAAHAEGDVLGDRYKLVRKLGEGGMGSVWKARNLALDVDVAVKVVKRTASSRRARMRLLCEARAVAKLAHPSIVRVFDFGFTDSGEPFLVMQLLRGKTLGAWLDVRGQLPATAAVQLLLPIADALAEVHALGIVHRDIKPENIIIEEGPSGELIPKLLDFGIAKQTGSDQSITQSGVLMGSPAYMSPEQARGEHGIEAQSDIWSLCVTLYEMIAGKRPFDGANHGAVLFSVFGAEPEPTHTQGAGDEALWEILQRGLAKAPGERWQSMRQLGAALAAWAVARGVTADVAGTSIAHQWLGRSSSVELTEEPPVAVVSAPPAAVPPRRRGRMLGLGGLCALLTSVLTFVALTPGESQEAAAAAVHSSQPAIVTVDKPQTVQKVDVSDASGTIGQAATVDALPPVAPAARSQETTPARAIVRPRRSSPRTSLPLPSRPDF